MKKVLIVSYAFSDKRAIGSIRIHGLAKFLPEFGWKPQILTAESQVKPDSKFNVVETPYESRNDKLKEGFSINERKTVIENKNKNVFIDFIFNLYSEIFNYPDKYKSWYDSALETGIEILKGDCFDAIISSSSPVTSHLIAYELKNEYGIPWTADLRDLWTQNHYYPYSKIRRLIEQKLELKILSRADALVTTTRPFAKKLKNMHKKETYCITNGFDNNEFENLKSGLTKKFSITYTGGLYMGKRDPSVLFGAIKELITEEIINPNDIEIRFYGATENWLEREINSYGLKNIVKYFGLVDRPVALQKQKESQLLLLLLWDNPEENNIPGKFFDYLAVKRPILTIGGNGGVIKELLCETNAGIFATSKKEIKNVVINSYHEWNTNGVVSYYGKISRINKYSHRNMANKFANILDSLTEKTSN